MILLAESYTATAVCLGALAVVIGWVLFRTHRTLSRQRGGNATLVHTARPHRADPGHNLDAPPDVLRWEVQMHETARELSAQLDSKMGALQALIADADRAAARLESAMAGDAQASAAESSEPARPEPSRPEPKPSSQAEALLPAGSSGLAAKHPRGQASDRPSSRHRHEQIYTLADYGFDAAEIAHRVETPVGEVELILGLRDKK